MRLAFGESPRPVGKVLATILFVGCSQHAFAAPSLDVLRYELAANQDQPELCFFLSQTVARRLGAPLESFVGVEPAISVTAIPRNNRLCLSGFAFGASYTVTLKPGLPGVAGALAKENQFRIDVPNRPPELSFAAPGSDLLPRLNIDGLPLRSVNVPKIDVALFRIADRDLLFDTSRAALTGKEVAEFVPKRGERVWQGAISPKGDPNRDALTTIPVASTIGALKPGLYVGVAWPSGMPIERSTDIVSTQYFTVSDLGLIAYRTADNLIVAARSLANSAGAEGIDVALIARNNREIARTRADGNGLARFDASLLNGAGGDRPAEIRAYGAAGDFSSLPLDDGSRYGPDHTAVVTTSGSAFFAARSNYRAGEAVDMLVLLRNAQGAATPKPNLPVIIRRPDGAVFDVRTLQDRGGGSYELAFKLPNRGAAGLWRIETAGDAGIPAAIVGEVAVNESPRSDIFATVTADSAVVDPAQPGSVAVQAQFPDGRPAANAPGELAISIEAATNPFPAFPSYFFGLADESRAPRQLDPVRFTTDGGGKANVPLKLGALPSATRPLEARATVKILDPGGRTSERVTDIPLANQALLLGVKPVPGPAFAEGQPARFEIIAVSPDGARQEKTAAGWEILRQDPAPSWTWDGTRFVYRSVFKDTHIAGGVVDIPADMPAAVTPSLPAGRYRIEVFDQGGESISSTNFKIGWTAPDTAEPPDLVEITPAKPFFTPGESADIFVRPPYESDVVLIPTDQIIRDPIVQHVPASGATMHLDMARDSGNVVQLLATSLAPPAAGVPGLARRAYGSALVPATPAVRRLDVKLTPPEKATPQQTLSVPVDIGDAGAEPVFVRVVAEEMTAGDADGNDRGALVRALGEQPAALSVRDIYGRIITPSGLTSAPLPQPPEAAVAAVASQPESARVALQSDIIALDKTGKGAVPLPLGEFSGRLRVKVIAWSASRSGQGTAAVMVRYPLTVELPLPTHLMPDDRADVALALDNVDGPRGEYRVKVTAEGAVSVPDNAGTVVNLAEHEQRTQPVTVTAHSPGTGTVTLSVQGPEGIAFERHLVVTVLPAAAAGSRHLAQMLKPGTILALDPAFFGGAKPEATIISGMASTGGAFDLKGLTQDLTSGAGRTAEQIIGAAIPCLAPKDLLASLGINGIDPGAPGPCLDRAIAGLMAMQDSDGGFNSWGAGESDPWLTAYAVDFLTRAKTAGSPVSDVKFQSALDYLAMRATLQPGAAAGPAEIAAAAYANADLAANGRLTIFQLRHFADQLQGPLRTPLALGLTAAAFATSGDKGAATALFAQALAMPAPNPAQAGPAAAGLSSELRDLAMLTAVMGESGAMAAPSLQTAAAKALAAATGRLLFNAEEAAWMFRAGAALPPSTDPIKLKVGDATIQQSGPYPLSAGSAGGLPSIKNLGDAAIEIVATATGAPAQTEAKDQAGIEIQRWLFDPAGKPVDPATLKQNDIIVVVLTGRAAVANANHPLIATTLPGGWVVEATDIADAATRYPWLKDLTGASHLAIEDGRYLAIPKLVGDRREFKLAFVVRAAVRGQYTLPDVSIEDIVQPALSARTAPGRMKIDAPS